MATGDISERIGEEYKPEEAYQPRHDKLMTVDCSVALLYITNAGQKAERIGLRNIKDPKKDRTFSSSKFPLDSIHSCWDELQDLYEARKLGMDEVAVVLSKHFEQEVPAAP